MMETHSNKALKTLTLMGTEPAHWHHTPVRYERRVLPMPGKVTCPDCCGHRWVQYDAAGVLIPMPPKDDHAVRAAYMREAEERWKVGRGGHERWAGSCEKCRCRNVRNRRERGRSTGKVSGMVEQEVWIGVVEWPVGAKFDSRFGGSHCQLCNKSIRDPWGWVPVTGTGADGMVHGMWVGRDCATRFLAVPRAKKDHLIGRGAA